MPMHFRDLEGVLISWILAVTLLCPPKHKLDYQVEISVAFSVHRLYTASSSDLSRFPTFCTRGGGEVTWKVANPNNFQNPDNFQRLHPGNPESWKPRQLPSKTQTTSKFLGNPEPPPPRKSETQNIGNPDNFQNPDNFPNLDNFQVSGKPGPGRGTVHVKRLLFSRYFSWLLWTIELLNPDFPFSWSRGHFPGTVPVSCIRRTHVWDAPLLLMFNFGAKKCVLYTRRYGMYVPTY